MKRDYKLQNTNGYIRWINYTDFIKTIDRFETKPSPYALITINFNTSSYIIDKLQSIQKEEKKDDIMILIIENNSNEEEKALLKRFIESHHLTNITVIETIENVGSAGAYALGIEYALSLEYVHAIYILEHDAILLEDQTLSSMIAKSTQDTIVYIKGAINTGCEISWLFQIGLFPRNFLQLTGVPNPSYFFRSDDLEWKKRFEIIQKRYGFKKAIINKTYFHPYLKKYNGQPYWMYFSVRNHLYTTAKWFSFEDMGYVITLFLYTWYGVSKLFIEKNSFILLAFLYALVDFVKGDYSFENNITKLKKLKAWNVPFPQAEEMHVSLDTLKGMTRNLYLLKYTFSLADQKQFVYSRNILHLFTRGIITGGWYHPLYPIVMLSKTILCVNEYSLEKNMYSLSIIKNKPPYFTLIISFLISSIIFLVLLPIIIGKGVLVYRKK